MGRQNDNDGKNPWGSGDNGRRRNPWGQGAGGPGGGGDIPPDMEDMLRRAQENLKQVMPGAGNFGKYFGLALLAIILLWLASGFYIVVPGEHAVEQRFGKWSETKTEEGWGYHLPWPIAQVTKVNVTQQRKLQIGFSETLSNSGTGTQRDVPEESLMLTSDRNIVDLDMVVQWDIKSAEDFLFNIREQEVTIKKVAESAIREVVGQTEMFPIITTARGEVADRAKAIMAANLDDYEAGVRIKQVLIQEAEVHPDVQGAFQDVQSAKQDAEDTQNQADTYRNDIIPKARGQAIQMKQEAQGYKEAVIARAGGDADRFNAVYQAYLGGKDVTRQRMYIETMEDVLHNAQKIILDQEGEGGTGVLPYLPLNELKPAAGRQEK